MTMIDDVLALLQDVETITPYPLPVVDGVTTGAVANYGRVKEIVESLRENTAWAPAPSGDPSGDEDTGQLQEMLDRANSQGAGIVRGLPGTYIINQPLRTYDSVFLEGNHPSRNNPAAGTRITTADADACAGGPMVDVQDTLFSGVRFIDFSPAEGNTCHGVSDSLDDETQAGFLLVEGNHFEGIGGTAIRLHGNVNFITRNRADNTVGHFIHLLNSGNLGNGSDCFVLFNDSGYCIGNAGFGGAEGTALLMEGNAANWVIGNGFYNFKRGMELDGSSYNRIIGNRCEKHDYDGILLGNGSNGNVVANNHAFNNGYEAASAGIHLTGASLRNQVTGNYIFNEAAYPGPETVYGIILDAVGGAASRNQVNGNHIYNMADNGILLASASFNQVNNNHIDTCGKDGIRLQAAANDNQVNGNIIYKPGQLTDDTYQGIIVTGTSDRNMLNGNTVRHGGASNRPQYGIQIVSGCSDNTVIGNDLQTAGRTYSFADGGTNTIHRDNRGYNGEACGVATVASGATSIVVAHGLGGWTPTVRDVMLTPTNNLGTATKFWVSAVDNANFTINVDVDPGATTATFAWAVHNIKAGQTM